MFVLLPLIPCSTPQRTPSLISRLPTHSSSHSSTNGSLPSQGFWSKLKGSGPKINKLPDMRQPQTPNMALSRQRLLTIVYGDMETVKMVRCPSALALPCSRSSLPVPFHLRCTSPSSVPHTTPSSHALSRNLTLWLEIGSNPLQTPSSVSVSPSSMSISRPP